MAKINQRDRDLFLACVSSTLSSMHVQDEERPVPDTQDFNRVLFSKREWRAMNTIRERCRDSVNNVRYITFEPKHFGIDPDTLRTTIPHHESLSIDIVAQCRDGLIRPPSDVSHASLNTTATVACRVFDDNRAYHRVKAWAKPEIRLAVENSITYALVEELMETATTWLQLQKWFPKIVNFARDYQGSGVPTYLDGSRAHNPPTPLVEALNKYGRFAMGRLLQAKMIQDRRVPLRYTKAYYPMFQRDIYHGTTALHRSAFRTG